MSPCGVVAFGALSGLVVSVGLFYVWLYWGPEKDPLLSW